MNHTHPGYAASMVATNAIELEALMSENYIRDVHYAVSGIAIEGVELEVRLAESFSKRTDGMPGYRMMVFVTDELWVRLAKMTIEQHEELRFFRRLSNSALLALRECSYSWSCEAFDRYEVGRNGVSYRANNRYSLWGMVQMATKDNYPSLKGQPLFLMYEYHRLDFYTVSIEGDRLLFHLPESLIERIHRSLVQARKNYL